MENNFFENKTILITGGSGYVAASLIRALSLTKCNLVLLMRTLRQVGPTESGKATVRIIQGDIRQKDIWNTLIEGVDIIFHLAGQTSLYQANKNPIADLELNVLPLLHLLETCRERKYKPAIIYAGSVTVSGLTTTIPVSENDGDKPGSIYDLHKISCENYLKHYVREGIVNGAILRLANVYGPGPKSSQADRGVLNKMMLRAMRGEDLTVYGDGNYTRDYVYIDDVARAFLLTAAKIDRSNGEHFLVGSGQGITIQKAFELVASRAALKTGVVAKVVNVAAPPDLPAIERRNFIADLTKISTFTGWTPRTNLTDGIDLTIASYATESK